MIAAEVKYFKFYPEKFADQLNKPKEEVGKMFTDMICQLMSGNAPEGTIAREMLDERNIFQKNKREAGKASAIKRWSKKAEPEQKSAEVKQEVEVIPPKPKRAKAEKVQVAKNVFLTQREMDNIIAEVGNDGFKRVIEILDSYKENKKGVATYANDAAAIRNWVKNRYLEETARAQRGAPKSFQHQERDRASKIVTEMFPELMTEFGLND